MGVYHKGGSNANDKTSIFDVHHDYAKKRLCPNEYIFFLASFIILILRLTNYCLRTLVRISFQQQLHSKPNYALDIPDVQ